MAEPEYSQRNPFIRLADAWYGTTQGEVDRGGYSQFARDLFLPDATMGDLSSRSYWSSDLPSDLSFLPGIDPASPVGYLRFNTGRPVMDAIATVVLNNAGIDNLLRAKSGVTRGDWGAYFRNVPLGTIEALSLATGVGALKNVGKKAVGRTSVTTGGLPTLTSPGLGIPLAGPTPATVAATGPRGITKVPGAVSGWTRNVVSNVASRFDPSKPVSSGVRTAAAGVRGAARNVRAYPGRYGLAALGAGVLSSAFFGQPRPTASEIAAQRTDPTKLEEEAERTIRDIVPVGDPITDAGNNARTDVDAINRQYNNILRELQGMYQLAETEQEKERLRFMLADIEAQRDAGLKAIADGYAAAVAAIRARAETARQQGVERSQQYGQQLEEMADRTAQRMMMQNIDQQQQFRGLGSGSQTPVNEWVGLMSSLAPMQQQYTQRMSDITGEGIDWMADTTSAQGQAQQADLQRLAAATRSAGIMSHQRQVADRIQRDAEQQRAAILQAMMQQAGAVGAAGRGGVSPFDRSASIEDYASQRLGPGYIEQWLRDTGQTSLTPGELLRIEALNSIALGQEMPNAARTPAGN